MEGGRLQELGPKWVKYFTHVIIYMKKLFNCDWLRAVQFKCNMPVPVSRKESGSSHCEISFSCACQEYDNVITPSCYPFCAPLSVKWSLTGG